MNQKEAQQHMADLVETFKVAYPFAFAQADGDAEELREIIYEMLRSAIDNNQTLAAAIVAMHFVHRASKADLLSFMMFLEADENAESEESVNPPERS